MLQPDICSPTTMSKVEDLRRFVGERLAAAAEEILGVFAKTIAEYDRELERLRATLAVVWQPQVKLLRIDDYNKEGPLTHQQISTQERVRSLEQVNPVHIKTEPEDLCSTPQGGDNFAVKQEDAARHLSPAWNNEPFGNLICGHTLPERSGLVLHTRIPGPLNPRASEERLSPKASLNASKEVRADQDVFKEEAFPTDQQLGIPSLDQQDPWLSQSEEEQEASFSGLEEERFAPKQENDDALISSPVQGDETSTVYLDSEVKHPGIYEKARGIPKESLTVSTETQREEFIFKEEALPPDQQLSNQDGVSSLEEERKGLCDGVGEEHIGPERAKNNGAISYMIWVSNPSIKSIGEPSGSSTPGTGASENLHSPDTTPTPKHKRYTCSICGKMFVYRSNFKAHMQVHRGDRPFSCTVCQRTFPKQGHLVTHMRSHTEKRQRKRYTCNICRKIFVYRLNFETHMQVHRGDKPFSCTVCKRTFQRQGHLVLHMKSHTEKRQRPQSPARRNSRRLAPKPSSAPVPLVLKCPTLEPEETGLSSAQSGVKPT